MITATLDQICRRGLLESNLPIHYYLEFLLHSQTCLRELNFDTLKLINSANLLSDANGNIAIPDDFTEDLAVALPIGQALLKLPKQDWITPLRIHSTTTGEFVSYSDQTTNEPVSFFGFPLGGFSWFWNVNWAGEPTGQFYGSQGGTNSGYTVFKQQRRIQLSEGLAGTNVVLLYVGDGSSIDNATQIDPQAFSTIQMYINWQRSPNKDNENSPEGRKYYNQRRKLVARLDPLTMEDIKNVRNNAYSAAIKN